MDAVSSRHDEVLLSQPVVPTSAAEWDAKRDVITLLYSTSNQSLKVVMEALEREHGFKAS